MAGNGQAGDAAQVGDGGPAASATLNMPSDVALDPKSGDLYIADMHHNRIRVAGRGSALVRPRRSLTTAEIATDPRRPDRRRRAAHRLAEGRRVLVRGVLDAFIGVLFLIALGILLHDEVAAG